jgi:transcription elongation factor GreA
MQSNQISLSQALTQYLSTRQFKAGIDTQQELSKFIRWCGRDRVLDNLTPQDTASYGERLAESSGWQDTTDRVQAIKDFLSFCYKSKFTQTSLAKHVRVRKSGRKSTASKEKARTAMDITPEGYQNMLGELETLRNERVAVAKEINLAAADKDFRENAPLDAARERQGLMEARIRELEDGLQRAHLTYTDEQGDDAHAEKRVRLGSKIKLADSYSKEEMVYTLVNAAEASPMDFKMSVASPVGKALIDHTVGEEVEVVTPRGNLRYRIKEVY